MTRKSQREIERAVEDLETTPDTPADRHVSLVDIYGETVGEFVYSVMRDLHMIQFEHHDDLVNVPPDTNQASTYLGLVRERYDIDMTRPDAVAETLVDSASKSEVVHAPSEQFTFSPGTVIRTAPDLADELATLLKDEREDAATRLLVQRTYDAFQAGGDAEA